MTSSADRDSGPDYDTARAYYYKNVMLTNATLTLDETLIPYISKGMNNKVTIGKGTTTTGTVTITVRQRGMTTVETLQYDGADISISPGALTKPVSYAFLGDIDQWAITFSGGNGSIEVSVSGW